MENKSILLVVGAILLSGMMIASAIVYNGAQYRSVDGGTGTAGTGAAPQEQQLIEESGIEVSLADTDPYQGNKSEAQVAIIEFSDYECPFCQRFHNDARTDILSEYVESNQAILVWKDLPLSFHDPLATTQAVAAQCANQVAGNDQYFEFSDQIFATTTSGGSGMEPADLVEIAREVEGLDFDAWNSCYENEETLGIVEANADQAAELGVTGTPGFIIGRYEDGKVVDGVRIAGALPFETFQEVIDTFLE